MKVVRYFILLLVSISLVTAFLRFAKNTETTAPEVVEEVEDTEKNITYVGTVGELAEKSDLVSIEFRKSHMTITETYNYAITLYDEKIDYSFNGMMDGVDVYGFNHEMGKEDFMEIFEAIKDVELARVEESKPDVFISDETVTAYIVSFEDNEDLNMMLGKDQINSIRALLFEKALKIQEENAQ